jgi:S1-C subfamily serine protease
LKKWLLGILIVVLLAGSGVNAYFYVQQNDRLNQVDQRISGLLDNINSVQNGLTSLQENVSTLDSSMSSLSDNVSALGGNITDLEGATSGLSDDVNTLKGNVTAVNGNITAVNSSVAVLQNSVSGMQSSVTALQANGQAVLNVIGKLTPVVVLVSTNIGVGSGTIIRANGYVLTAYHVVQGSTSITVTLSTGEKLGATVAASDTNLDIAILKITSTRTDFPVATLGSSASANVGDDVVAIGFPMDLVGPASFTKGIISAFRTDDGSFFANNGERYIQTDAAVNPGNSGGPLVNMKGEVIGIADFILLLSNSPIVPTDNMGFFIAVEQANSLIVKAAGA